MDSHKLTEEQKQNAMRFLTEKGAIKACPMCGHPQWEVADFLVIDNGFAEEGFVLGGQAYPLVVLFCDNCAFARMHSAVALGIIPPFAEPEGKDGK